MPDNRLMVDALPGLDDSATAPGKQQATMGLSIVVPAYNEENGIGDVLQQLQDVMAGSDIPYEIIAVDDGSKDATYDICSKYDGVKVVQHRVNRGYGAAIKTGIKHSRYELTCITDADGTYPNEHIPQLASQMIKEGIDMVVGARTGEHTVMPLIRKPAKWTISRLANFVSGQSIPDLNSGLRVFKRSVALRFLSILPDGFSLTTTITLAMLTNNYLVEYVPINYFARVGNSKIRPIHDTVNFIQLVMRIALYFAPLKLFFPFSVLFLAAAVGWALFTRFALGQLADVSTLVLVMTAVQIAAIGMLAELINRRATSFHRED